MKRFLLLLVIAAFTTSMSFADGLLGKKVPYSSLPSNSQTFFSKHFKVSSVKQIKETKEKFEVKFDSDSEVEFYARNGEWFDLKCSQGIPNAILSTLPAEVTKYVKSNYPKFKVVAVDRSKGYELELDNGLKLKFTPDGKFIKMK